MNTTAVPTKQGENINAFFCPLGIANSKKPLVLIHCPKDEKLEETIITLLTQTEEEHLHFFRFLISKKCSFWVFS